MLSLQQPYMHCDTILVVLSIWSRMFSANASPLILQIHIDKVVPTFLKCATGLHIGHKVPAKTDRK
jgi:hypothetical protein